MDRWFAYTAASAAKLADQGFPPERTTVVNNSTDVTALRRALSAVSAEQSRGRLTRCFGSDIGEDAFLAVFCSRLSGHKDIDFMLATAERVRRLVPGFLLIVMGGGERQQAVEAFCRERTWCACLGPVHGDDRAPYLKRADLWLTSGAVGLEVVDAMAAGVPLVMREGPGHGPERAYVQPGRNAAVFDGDANAYANRIAALLADPARLRDMRAAARKTGDGLGVEAMASRFADGIEDWLGPMNQPRPVEVGPHERDSDHKLG